MKLTKQNLVQIIKEELESILNEYGNISHVLGEGTPDKEQEWSEFVKNYTTSTDDSGLLCVEMWEDSVHAKESEIDVLTTVQLK